MIGSSPQARGTPAGGIFDSHGRRFIPAGAGNTPPVLPELVPLPVHPRRRGEHNGFHVALSILSGSSPQARGTRAAQSPAPDLSRFIPAGAGNTPVSVALMMAVPVHPRRRGEHIVMTEGRIVSRGSSPQARGTPGRNRHRKIYNRFIPAGAGNTSLYIAPSITAAVHPRRRGEHNLVFVVDVAHDGSSPQARGTLLQGANLDGARRFIPAGAGNTPPAQRL